MKISILGSCVTRDALNYCEDTKIYLANYIARTSMVSQSSKGFDISIEKIDIKSSFQKKMVYNDINKLTIKQLKQNKSDIIIMDFIDERLRLIKTNDNRYVTYSSEYKKSKYLRDKIKGKLILEEERIELWKKSISEFFYELNKFVEFKKIYINECYYCKEYLSKNDGKKNFLINIEIDKSNEILKEYYNYIKIKYPDIRFLAWGDGYIADESHRWGLSTYHYEERYYINLMKQIIDIKEKIKDDNNRG